MVELDNEKSWFIDNEMNHVRNEIQFDQCFFLRQKDESQAEITNGVITVTATKKRMRTRRAY